MLSLMNKKLAGGENGQSQVIPLIPLLMRELKFHTFIPSHKERTEGLQSDHSPPERENKGTLALILSKLALDILLWR